MSSEEKKKKKKEKAQRLREKQEQHLKKVKDDEQKEKEKSEKDLVPEEMSKKGYTISDKELASGQFSSVLKAKLDDEDIAAKIIEKKDKDEAFKKLIPRFVRIMRALDERHPNIIDILDVFETSKRVIILMRLTPNGSLYDFMDKRSELLDENQTRKWAQQLISGLTYLHINGIVHRDLRTDRIFLDRDNCLKISGFTYSRLWINPKDNSKALSKTCGTTGPFCAPEALAGESYDPRTADVWAFGVIVFFVWNKIYPFDYNMTHRLVVQHKNNEWVKRMRQESNEDIKEFFKQIFEVNHNKRRTVTDIVQDKWLDSKIQIIEESTKDTKKEPTVHSTDVKKHLKAEEPNSDDKKAEAVEIQKDDDNKLGKTEESKSEDSKSDKAQESTSDNKKTDDDGLKNNENAQEPKSNEKKSEDNESKSGDKKSSKTQELKENKSEKSEESKSGEKPEKPKPEDKVEEPKGQEKVKKEEKDSDDEEETSIVDEDDDEEDLNKTDVMSDQNKGEDKSRVTEQEKKDQQKTEVTNKEKSNPQKTREKSNDSHNVLKADILEQLKREFMELEDKK